MPLYVYACPDCDARSELIRPIAERNDEVRCAVDGQRMTLAPSVAAERKNNPDERAMTDAALKAAGR